jgi:acetyl esterase/lipase
MRPEDYPPQEPLSPAGQTYAEEVLRRGAGVSGIEVSVGADPYQSLTVYRSPLPTGLVLVFLHGGGWTSGYKEWMAFMAPPLVAAGVTFVSAGYRLAPAHVFPTGYRDVIIALAWVHEHIATFGGRPNQIFLGGHSAGGHYAALLAVRRDWKTAGLPQNAVRGCLPVSGVYDFTEGSGLSIRPRFLGPKDNERRASPRHQIAGRPPPFLIAYGEKDFPHLVRQAEEMKAALERAGGTVESLVLPACDHFSASYAVGDAAGPWVPRALTFMARHAG